MGKKSRRAKAKTSDFQKVKLKVGKKRPLPSNVTEVAFKSQAIYIPEQMKSVAIDEVETGGEVTSSENIPELLSKVGHFNSNFRIDSLTSLRVFFTNNKKLIHQYLPKIMEKVPRTIADEEQQVRKSSISFFKVLFSSLEEQEMSPFYDVFLSHLYCAMSHIFDDIQKDSLQIVDLCVEYFPALLSHNARNMILQHFVELISMKQTKSAASAKGPKANPGVKRVLSMKLSSKESSIVWRNRILKRLNDLLRISTTSSKASDDSKVWIRSLERQSMESVVNDEDGVRVRWNSCQIGEVLTHFESHKLALPLHSLRSNPLSTITSLSDTEESDSSPLTMIMTLYPLLFDCWHEATSDENKCLSAEAKETMSHTLSIVNILLERYLESSDSKEDALGKLRLMFMNDFKQYFFEAFPFSEFTGRQPSSKRKKPSQERVVNVQDINLSVCALVTSLASEKHLNDDSETLSTVATYLSMVLMSAGGSKGPALDSVALDRCITAIEKLLDIAVDDETRENLLQPLLVLYHSLNSYSAEKSRLLQFFLNLHTNEKTEDFSSNEVITEWLCSLPDLLIEVLSSTTRKGSLCSESSTSSLLHLILRCIRLACLRGKEHFLNCLEEKTNVLLEILRDHGSKLFCPAKVDEGVNSCRNSCSNFQRRLFEIFLHCCHHLKKEKATLISQICNGVEIIPENVIYVVEMFLHRFQNSKSPEDFVLMMQFVVTILLGNSKENLQSLESSTALEQSYPFRLNTGKSEEFLRHAQIVKKLCQILPTIEQISRILEHFICEKILHKDMRSLPAKSVYGILNAGKLLLLSGELKSHLASQEVLVEKLGKLCADVLLVCHNLAESPVDPDIRDGLFKEIFLLLKSEGVLNSCISDLHNADLQNTTVWKSVCQVVQTLAANTKLHESLVECQKDLKTLLKALGSSNVGKSSDDTLQATELSASFFLKK